MVKTVNGFLVDQIVSGGQTGVDRGGLEAAMALGVDHGGWCPRGRLAEDGQIPPQFCLTESSASEYPVRTEQNVIDSDGTLIFYRESLSGGTKYTKKMATRHLKPYFLIDLTCDLGVADIRDWLRKNDVRVLNIAGPRESSQPGISAEARDALIAILALDE